MTVYVVLKDTNGEKHMTTFHDVRLVETKWIDEFKWYGRVLRLSDGDTATFRVPVEMYGASINGFIEI